MDWRKIPSLSGLRALEATARLGSFTQAAVELNVTHAAIAQHVRGLETHFDQKLVARAGRKMGLTDAGTQLAQSLSQAFGIIEGGVNDLLLANVDRPLNITVTPSFAENWLVPRLGDFWAKHPDIELALHPKIGLSDLKADGMDVALRYGLGSWSEYHSELLTEANWVAVATPGFVGDLRPNCLNDLAGLPWVLEGNRPELALWAESEGLDLSKVKATYFPTGTLALTSVRQGLGIGINTVALVERDLAEGKLVSLCTSTDQSLGYHIVTRKNQDNANLRTFIKWLRTSK